MISNISLNLFKLIQLKQNYTFWKLCNPDQIDEHIHNIYKEDFATVFTVLQELFYYI